MSNAMYFRSWGARASNSARFFGRRGHASAGALVLLAAVLLFIFSFSGPAAAFPYSQVVAFGNSLSDKGNLYAATFGLVPDSNDYWEGRYSNGPLWVEYLTDEVTTDGELVNFAFAGATVDSITPPGMQGQVLSYTASRESDADMLFTIWIGGNDVSNGSTDYDFRADAIHDSLEELASDGARQFLVLNVPNLGAIPRFNTNATDSVKFMERSMAFNEALDSQLDRFARDHPDYELYRLDTFFFMEDIVAHPAQYGFVNVFDPSPVRGDGFSNIPAYLFWDDMHPTTEAHAVVAQRAVNILTADPASYTGWWYNPDESGSAVSLEIYNGAPFAAWYLYDQSGRPVWYTADGFYSGNTFYGDMYLWTGWPLGGQYAAPVRQPVGSMTISFQSSLDAQMRWSAQGTSGSIWLRNFLQTTSPGVKDPRDISGWWIDPAYNGMGFFMEASGGTLFLAWYHYREDGSSRWWSVGGAFPQGSTTFSGTLLEYTGGQCLGCPYQEPVSQEKDTITLEFAPDGTASLTRQGAVFSLHRFRY